MFKIIIKYVIGNSFKFRLLIFLNYNIIIKIVIFHLKYSIFSKLKLKMSLKIKLCLFMFDIYELLLIKPMRNIVPI